jgi:hypothetical protein
MQQWQEVQRAVSGRVVLEIVPREGLQVGSVARVQYEVHVGIREAVDVGSDSAREIDVGNRFEPVVQDEEGPHRGHDGTRLAVGDLRVELHAEGIDRGRAGPLGAEVVEVGGEIVHQLQVVQWDRWRDQFERNPQVRQFEQHGVDVVPLFHTEFDAEIGDPALVAFVLEQGRIHLHLVVPPPSAVHRANERAVGADGSADPPGDHLGDLVDGDAAELQLEADSPGSPVSGGSSRRLKKGPRGWRCRHHEAPVLLVG